VPTQVTPPGRPRPAFHSAQDGIDPETSPPLRQPVEMTRGQFFAMVVLAIEEKEYTVAEIVKFEAYVMGGVHPGSASSTKEASLEELNKLFRVGGYAASLRQLQAIGRVVLRALEPLREKVAQGLA
jgi:hypothetical protein